MTAMKTNNTSNDFHTVLIISTDLEMAEIWENLFRQKNCLVIGETSPESAIQTGMLINPTLIVLDLDLPQPIKLDLCRKLRNATNGTLLLLSPSGSNQNIFEYSHAGVDELVTTPISPMALLIKSMAWLVRQEWIAPRAQAHI